MGVSRGAGAAPATSHSSEPPLTAPVGSQVRKFATSDFDTLSPLTVFEGHHAVTIGAGGVVPGVCYRQASTLPDLRGQQWQPSCSLLRVCLPSPRLRCEWWCVVGVCGGA